MTDKIIENIKKIYEIYKNKNTNKKSIVVSITAFEAYDCLLDLILNITYFFQNYNVKILISLKNNCNIDLKFDHVFIHTINNTNISLWGNISNFHQHFLAYEYCKNNNILFDYFTLCTSNQLFFKIVTDDNINDALMTIDGKIKNEVLSDDKYEKYFNDFLKHNKKWEWFTKSLNDTYFTSYMKNNKYIYHCYGHEGLIFDKKTINFIMEEYEKNNFFEKCEFRNFTMEEIFPFVYLLNNYKIQIEKNKSLCDRSFSYDGRINKNTLSEIQEWNENTAKHVCSLKPVKRIFDDEYRKNIRNYIFDEIKKYNT